MVAIVSLFFLIIYHQEIFQIIVLRKWNLKYSYKNLNFNAKTIIFGYIILAMLQGVYIICQGFQWKHVSLYILFTIFGIYHIMIKLLEYSQDYEYFENYYALLIQVCSEYESNPSIYICLESILLQQGYFKEKIDLIFSKLKQGEISRDDYLNLSTHYLYHSLVKIIEFNEKYGDLNYKDKLNRIMNEIDNWYDIVFQHQYEILKFQKQIWMLICCGLVVSYFSINMLNQVGDVMYSDISNQLLLAFCIINLLIYQKSIRIFHNAFQCEVENIDW